eukprot:764652-Amphidinium_carterae.1
MGQGQERVALDALNKTAKEGGWIVLQNIHLMQAKYNIWLGKSRNEMLPRAVKTCLGYPSMSLHKPFRAYHNW